jgi:hypothetical protein
VLQWLSNTAPAIWARESESIWAYPTILTATQLSMFVTDHAWVWPACETLHFMGLALVIGNIGLLDFRLLGIEKGMAFGPLNRFVRWAVLGFLINLATGIMFFVGNPAQYVNNVAFGYKLAFMALAGVNVLIFYVSSLARAVEALGPGDDAPLGAKLVAAASLFLWVAVMYMGRMLPYIGNSF